MALKPFVLEVLTPTRTLLDARGVTRVQVQLADGAGADYPSPLGIYPGHAPLLAETVSAPLVYVDAAGEHTLDLATGILYVKRQPEPRITIFTSGLAGDAEQSTSDVDADVHFDRLAQALMSSLQSSDSQSMPGFVRLLMNKTSESSADVG